VVHATDTGFICATLNMSKSNRQLFRRRSKDLFFPFGAGLPLVASELRNSRLFSTRSPYQRVPKCRRPSKVRNPFDHPGIPQFQEYSFHRVLETYSCNASCLGVFDGSILLRYPVKTHTNLAKNGLALQVRLTAGHRNGQNRSRARISSTRTSNPFFETGLHHFSPVLPVAQSLVRQRKHLWCDTCVPGNAPQLFQEAKGIISAVGETVNTAPKNHPVVGG
jgi:hypothetical protein